MSSYALRSKQEMPEISFEECARRLAEAERYLHKKAAIMASFLEIFWHFQPNVERNPNAYTYIRPHADEWEVGLGYGYNTLGKYFYPYTCERERKAIKNYLKRAGIYAH